MDRIVREAAERHKVDPALVKAVISTESGWNPQAVSRKGAVGLMQLIPETAQRFGVGNPFDPAQNVEGGTTYLKSLLDRYNGDLTKTLAAYNAGERAVDRAAAFRVSGNAKVRAESNRRIFPARLGTQPDALESAKASGAAGSGFEWPGSFHERMKRVLFRGETRLAERVLCAAGIAAVLALCFALPCSRR